MKAKIRFKIKNERMDHVHSYWYYKTLQMYIKFEKHILPYRYTIISQDASEEEFYDKVIEFLNNTDNIKQKGEEVVKNIYKTYLEKQNKKGKVKEVERLLKELKQPIEIEVKL